MAMYKTPNGCEILGSWSPEYENILTTDALSFLATLHRTFNEQRTLLMKERQVRQIRISEGEMPDFLPETKHIREADWRVDPVPSDLQDRRVEITGPTDRKMVINALNSGATMYMADFEDSNTPTWENQVNGQINMKDAVAKKISFVSDTGKNYQLGENLATLLVRPRGWHLDEKNVLVDGVPMSGSLFDFGLYFFHNAAERVKQKSGIYLYLPKLESHLEARLWNQVFLKAQELLNVPRGTVKATVLIETILATFEMDEILYELKEHSAGLNCGRWDYIFSCIKKFRSNPEFVLADRNEVTMTSPFMRAYSLLLIQTCHKRGAFAMGGMAAQIPIKNDAEANQKAIEKVRMDKKREVTDGHDGTWVAHPGLVPIAKEIFDDHMTTPNQINKQRDDVEITSEDLLNFKPQAPITEEGLRANISIGIQYLGAWLGGTGCVPIFNLMEDAATAEISRGQIWHWIRSDKGILEDGREITKQLFSDLVPQELKKIQNSIDKELYSRGKYGEAAKMFSQLILDDSFVEFLTLPAYEYVVENSK